MNSSHEIGDRIPSGTGHVVDEAGDYLAGRCNQERAQAIRSHLWTCADCAADFALAAQLRASGHPERAHLSALRVGELSAQTRPLDLGEWVAPFERDHLLGCSRCRREIALLGSAAPPPELVRADVEPSREPARAHGRVERPASSWWSSSRWRWALGAVTVAATVLVTTRAFNTAELTKLRALAQIEPLRVEIARGEAPTEGFDQMHTSAMEAYQAGDYASASTLFAGADQLKPDDPIVLLYWGSSELLRHQPEQAEAVLERAARAAGLQGSSHGGELSDTMAVEVLWQLAQAHLAAGDRRDAVRVLQQLASWKGARAEAVDALLARVKSIR